MRTAALREWRCVLTWVAVLVVILPAQGQHSGVSRAGQAVGPGNRLHHQHAPHSQKDVSLPLSSHECVVEDGKPEHRVCIFKNIVLWEGQLQYVAHGELVLPAIDINWLEPERLNIQVVQQDDLPQAWSSAQVEDVPLALLGHQVNFQNYYHLWLLEERGDHLTGLTAHLPALNHLYSCLSPTPPRHIKEHTNYGQVVVFEKAIAGMGPDVRAFHQWRPRFFDHFVASSAESMHSWRHRLAQCLAAPFDTAVASQKPVRVTIVNRSYKAGRHLLNAGELQARILGKWAHSVVQVVDLQGLDLHQQIALFQQTSILIWTHGAAMADLLFLPQGAGAIELIPWPHAEQAHEWAQSLAADFDLHVQVAWTRLTDVSHLHYQTEVLFKDPTWQALTDEERLLFLEKGTCPGKSNTPLHMLCRNHWMHYLVSFVQPWEPLEKLLDAAHSFVQNQNFPAVSVVT
ncbi:hypothetical protein WJX79_005487 [Trebouxia sp. C0005]